MTVTTMQMLPSPVRLLALGGALALSLACGGAAPEHAEHGHEEAATPAPSEPEAAGAHEGHEAADHAAHTKQEGAAHAEPAHDGALALTLDGDAKWPMDDHTRRMIAITRTTLANATVTTPAEALALGLTLQSQLDTLITGCTMDGEAHNQLHAFLTAYQPAVAALKEVADDEAAAAQLAQLRELVTTYDAHFE